MFQFHFLLKDLFFHLRIFQSLLTVITLAPEEQMPGSDKKSCLYG